MGRRQIGVLVLAGVLSLVAAATANAASEAVLEARGLPTATGGVTARFDLVGMHWRGGGSVGFRTRTVGGRWSAWRPVDVDERPDRAGPETARTRGLQVGEPYWTGPSNRIEWKSYGAVRKLRVFFVRSPVRAVPARELDIAGSPTMVMRRGWNADEKIRRHAPRYAPLVRFAVVHHTAGANSYSAAESAAIVRAIEIYHVKGNGWNDIGYNFLVDRFGQVFEGRYGGVTRNVVGAHSAGFNTGSVGVAVIGTYRSKQISTPARAALVRLLAWRLDLAHADPLGALTWVSGGNSRYPPSRPVTLRTISTHRDTAATDCPGDALYGQLPAIAASVSRTGVPKLYDPLARGSLGDFVRFTARLSSPQTWTVSVRNPAGVPVGSGSGTGAAVRWTWDARQARAPAYAWRIESPSARAAVGTIGPGGPVGPPQALPPALSELAVAPAAISPDGDGYADSATVTYRLRRAALVSAVVIDEEGVPLATLFRDQRQSARVQSWSFTAESLPDGRYALELSARGGDGAIVRVRAPVLVDRTLGFLSAQPPAFSPNGDGKLDTITFGFALQNQAHVSVRVVQSGVDTASVFAGDLQPGLQRFVWDGKTAAGMVLDGSYDLVVSAVGPLGVSTQSVGFRVDSSAQ